MVKICVGSYQLKPFKVWNEFSDHLSNIVKQAKSQKAELILLPKYSGLEMNNIGSNQTTESEFENVHSWHVHYLELCSALAKKHAIYLQPGTVPYKVSDNQWRNRAYFFYPSGEHVYQDKIQFTKSEKDTKLLERGERLKIIKTPFANIGIAICYDVEFPELITRFVTAGVQLLLVPSCTENLQGFNRVNISCRARAIENQIFVANSCTVLDGAWSATLCNSVGKAGVFSPADGSFNEDGIVLQGELNVHQQYFADLHFKDLEDCRAHGAVANFLDSRKTFLVEIEF